MKWIWWNLAGCAVSLYSYIGAWCFDAEEHCNEAICCWMINGWYWFSLIGAITFFILLITHIVKYFEKVDLEKQNTDYAERLRLLSACIRSAQLHIEPPGPFATHNADFDAQKIEEDGMSLGEKQEFRKEKEEERKKKRIRRCREILREGLDKAGVEEKLERYM